MALTKSDASIHSAASLSPSAGSTVSSWIDVQDSYETQVQIKVTNGTNITVGARVRVEVASQSIGVNSYFTPDMAAPIADGAVTSWSVTLPIGVEFFRTYTTHPTYTGSASTIDAEYSKVTGI